MVKLYWNFKEKKNITRIKVSIMFRKFMVKIIERVYFDFGNNLYRNPEKMYKCIKIFRLSI